MLFKRPVVAALLLWCTQCNAEVVYDRCTSYHEYSYDGAICDTMLLINLYRPECFIYPPIETEVRYQSIRADVESAAVIINKFRNSGLINKLCLSEQGLTGLDNTFFNYFRASSYVKEYFKEIVRHAFSGDTIPQDIEIVVPGSGVFFEASAVFEMFNPSKVFAIDPNSNFRQSSLIIYDYPAHKNTINYGKLEHIEANLGSVVEQAYCDKRHVHLGKDGYSGMALFIHPGPIITGENQEFSTVWRNVFSHALDHVYHGGFALFIVHDERELYEIRRFLAGKEDYKEKSSFCTKGLVVNPFRFPEQRIYKCVLNVKREMFNEF